MKRGEIRWYAGAAFRSCCAGSKFDKSAKDSEFEFASIRPKCCSCHSEQT